MVLLHRYSQYFHFILIKIFLFLTFIFLAVLCSMWDLSSSVRGSNLCPLCWKGRVQSSTGLPGKAPQDLVN